MCSLHMVAQFDPFVRSVGDSNLEWNVRHVTSHLARLKGGTCGCIWCREWVTADLEWNGVHVCVTFDLAEIYSCPVLSVFQAQVCM